MGWRLPSHMWSEWQQKPSVAGFQILSKNVFTEGLLYFYIPIWEHFVTWVCCLGCRRSTSTVMTAPINYSISVVYTQVTAVKTLRSRVVVFSGYQFQCILGKKNDLGRGVSRYFHRGLCCDFWDEHISRPLISPNSSIYFKLRYLCRIQMILSSVK